MLDPNDPLLKSLLDDGEKAPAADEPAEDFEVKQLYKEYKNAADEEAGLRALRQLVRKLK